MSGFDLPGAPPATPLRIFTDDTDTCIARDLTDAMVVMHEYGISDPDPDMWGPVEDDAEITIWCDTKGVPSVPGEAEVVEVTKTARAWIASRGRGFLCSTEF